MKIESLNPAAASRCRIVSRSFGDFKVPRHIVRLDSVRLAGWQVRWQGSTRYFSDSAAGSPAKALTLAIKHLRRVWKPIKKITRRNPNAGVSLRKNPSDQAWYAVASHPRSGSPKRFYAGTDATRTTVSTLKAIERAKRARRRMLTSIPVPLR